MLKNDTMLTLVDQTAEKIYQFILKSNYQKGDKLPNEYTIAENLKIGRSTLREAIKILVSENVVEVRHGSGTYVKSLIRGSEDPLGFSQVKDSIKLTHDLFETRFLIEPRMASLAAMYATEAEIAILEKIMLAIEQEIDSEGSIHFELDIQFHSAIAEASRNLAMKHLLPIIIQSIQLYNVHFTNDEAKKATIEMHREIFNAIKNHRPEAAYDSMLIHLANNRRILEKI